MQNHATLMISLVLSEALKLRPEWPQFRRSWRTSARQGTLKITISDQSIFQTLGVVFPIENCWKHCNSHPSSPIKLRELPKIAKIHGGWCGWCAWCWYFFTPQTGYFVGIHDLLLRKNSETRAGPKSFDLRVADVCFGGVGLHSGQPLPHGAR